jgi:glycosyltransferase involved in cell wall biosynthesis
MRIAFYAPMKSPDSPVPSGDRQMARNLIRALETAGHGVAVASRFSSRDGAGDPSRQARLSETGTRLAHRLVRRWRSADAPDAWFTYHLYHKAPDYLGPAVTAALGIPYIIAEASHAPKRAGGPWDAGFRAAERAIRAAHAVIGFSSLDAACVRPLLADPSRYHALRPFTDVTPFAAAAAARDSHRTALAARFGWPEDETLLLAVGMMRTGDKLASYRALGSALENIASGRWRLVVVGDGPARPEVERALSSLNPGRVGYTGAVAPADLPGLYAGADILAWPAINEAYGLALLEGQAAGLPVVAGRAGGVGDIVHDGETGLLVPEGDVESFAAALAQLIDDPPRRAAMRARAHRIFPDAYGMAEAATRLDGILRDIPGRRAA